MTVICILAYLVVGLALTKWVNHESDRDSGRALVDTLPMVVIASFLWPVIYGLMAGLFLVWTINDNYRVRKGRNAHPLNPARRFFYLKEKS